MKEIILWSIVWFTAWAILNVYFRWSWEKLKSKKYIPRGLYFLICYFAMFILFKELVRPYLIPLTIGFLVSNFSGLFFGFDRKFYFKFSKDRYYLLFHSFNILFQQISILIAILIVKKLIGINYRDIHFGLFFVSIHFPLAFLPWAKLKYYLLAGCFIGGWLFSYLNLNFQYGITLSFLIHYFVYVWQIHYLKDEEKI